MGSKKHRGKEHLAIIHHIVVPILCLVRNLNSTVWLFIGALSSTSKRKKIIIAQIKDFVLILARNSSSWKVEAGPKMAGQKPEPCGTLKDLFICAGWGHLQPHIHSPDGRWHRGELRHC